MLKLLRLSISLRTIRSVGVHHRRGRNLLYEWRNASGRVHIRCGRGGTSASTTCAMPRSEWRPTVTVGVPTRMPNFMTCQRRLPHETTITTGERARKRSVTGVYTKMGFQVETFGERFAATREWTLVLCFTAGLAWWDRARSGMFVRSLNRPPNRRNGALHGERKARKVSRC